MTRRYRDKSTGGVTTSRAAARANRRLQLISSNTFSGTRGKTLLEKMEDSVDAEIVEREKKTAERDAAVAMQEKFPKKAFWSDDLEDEYYDWMLKNEGKILGMLKMLAIMRSTSMKTEQNRAKARIKYNGRTQAQNEDEEG